MQVNDIEVVVLLITAMFYLGLGIFIAARTLTRHTIFSATMQMLSQDDPSSLDPLSKLFAFFAITLAWPAVAVSVLLVAAFWYIIQIPAYLEDLYDILVGHD